MTATAVVQFPTRETVWDREAGRYARSLAAAGLSPNTIRSYDVSLRMFRAWLVETDRPLDPALVGPADIEAFIQGLRDRGLKPTTITQRWIGLGTFWKYLADPAQGVIERSPFEGLRRPSIGKIAPPPVIATGDIERLMATMPKASRSFAVKRDRAVILLLLSTGARRAEIANLTLDDVDTGAGTVWLRGKTGERLVRFGDETAAALDGYLRMREHHPWAHREFLVGDRRDQQRRGLPFWLVEVGTGNKGGLSGSGIHWLIARRCAEAGIAPINPHAFRHTWADAMLASGHQEGDVMRLGGWSDRTMLNRYGASQAEARARANYHDPVDRFWANRKR